MPLPAAQVCTPQLPTSTKASPPRSRASRSTTRVWASRRRAATRSARASGVQHEEGGRRCDTTRAQQRLSVVLVLHAAPRMSPQDHEWLCGLPARRPRCPQVRLPWAATLRGVPPTLGAGGRAFARTPRARPRGSCTAVCQPRRKAVCRMVLTCKRASTLLQRNDAPPTAACPARNTAPPWWRRPPWCPMSLRSRGAARRRAACAWRARQPTLVTARLVPV